LPSYLIVPLPKSATDKERIKEVVCKFSAIECQAQLKFGTIPESLTEIEGVLLFYYVIEYEEEYETIEGMKKIEPPPVEKIPVAILHNNVLIIGHSKKEFEDKVLSFVSEHIAPGYVLQNVEFEEEVLRSVVERYPDVLQLDLTPMDGRIDKISCIGRGLTYSDFWRDYGDQPLIYVKARLVDLPEEANVGFRKKGIITIYNRNFSIQQQIRVLKEVVRMILPYMKTTFQTRLR
jgi:hypothetical protein